MKKYFWVGLGILFLLTAVVGFRTLRFTPQVTAHEAIPKIPLNETELAERLAGAVRIPTRSFYEKEKKNPEPFRALHAFLRRNFPHVFKSLKVENFGEFSLLLEWKGKNPSLKPLLMLAHQDVVPISPGTEEKWEHPPFSGLLADGYVWGRGTLDDKASLMAILESVEKKITGGFQPERTVFFAFGDDEELGGGNGAKKIGAELQKRKIEFETVLDEGGLVSVGQLEDISAPIATVGIAEKGYVSVELTARERGGHSSLPPKKTTIGRVAAAILKLQGHEFPARIEGPSRLMLEALGPEMRLKNRVALANLWLFGPLVENQLSQAAAGNATIRTTTAPTIFQAGDKENVLPAVARAVVNFRTMPGENTETVVKHVRDVIQDPDMELKSSTHGEPSGVSSTRNAGFLRLEQVIHEVYPGTLVTPSLTLASTDSKHYSMLAQSTLRFVPIKFGTSDMARFHGTNERVSIAEYADLVRFYMRYLEVASAL